MSEEEGRGRKTAETNKRKYGEDFYSAISKRRKTFSGGKTFKDSAKAREAQAKGAASRRRNNAKLRKPTD